uniref:Uncharacterized protein n=1 Tax=Cacopsylla melanoneura TaxID=428564 RepID=A0A8D8T816_9HEMI
MTLRPPPTHQVILPRVILIVTLPSPRPMTIRSIWSCCMDWKQYTLRYRDHQDSRMRSNSYRKDRRRRTKFANRASRPRCLIHRARLQYHVLAVLVSRAPVQYHVMAVLVSQPTLTAEQDPPTIRGVVRGMTAEWTWYCPSH